MTQTYRTTDPAKWGTGKGSNLTAGEVDNNFWDAIQRIVAVETATAGIHAGIDHFTVSGTSFYVVLTDATTLGPYTLPVASFRARGAWTPSTAYSVLDTVTANGNLYEVIFAHTSSSGTFDPAANDGSGHSYYSLMLQTPGNSLPTGGAAGQRLKKSTSSDYAVTWDWDFPVASSANKVLKSHSTTRDDVAWGSVAASEVTFTPPTGSGLSATNVEDAIDELITGGAIDASAVPYTPSTGSGLSDTNVESALNTLGVHSKLGRHTMWVPASAMTPSPSFGPSLGMFETSTFQNIVKTLDFSHTTSQMAQFEVSLPKSWDKGDIAFRIFWSHPSTTGNWDVSWQVYANSTISTLDAAIHSHTNIDDTGGTTNNIYISDESDPLTIVDVNTGSPPSSFPTYLIVQVLRHGGIGDMAVNARLHGIQVYYNVNAATDN